MEKTVWERLVTGWTNMHYTGILWFICSLFALIVGIKYYRKDRSYQLFILYCLSNTFLLNIVNNFINYSFNLKGIRHVIYLETANTLFALLEITAFFYLFKEILNIKFVKHMIKICWIVFLFFCVIFFWKTIENKPTESQITNNSFIINCIEFFMLLFLCLLYFYELLTKETRQVIPLTQSPSFWIISGLFFYCIVSLPVLLIGYKLFITNRDLYFIMFSIHYLSLSFLSLCLAKAFSCKTTLTI